MTVPLVEVIVSLPLTVTKPVVRVFITLVVAAILVESVITKSVTLAPLLVMTDNVEMSRMLMSVYPKMVEAVAVSVSVVKVVSTTVVPLAAVSVVSGFVLILSFVKLVMVFIEVDVIPNNPVLLVLVLGEVNTVIVVSIP
jgi:hypothetical protein